MSKIDVAGFFQTVQDKHATGQATEHSYRPALEKLLKSINPKLTVINEPKQTTDVGKPDFVIMRGDGNNVVGRIGKQSFDESNDGTGNVFINDHQYFEGVPKTAWEFYIGGYQPAQKWLKDRKGRELSFDERMHYRKIIHILMETDRIMKTIDIPLGNDA